MFSCVYLLGLPRQPVLTKIKEVMFSSTGEEIIIVQMDQCSKPNYNGQG